MTQRYSRTLGGVLVEPSRCCFRVWCPNARRVELVLLPQREVLYMQAEGDGYYAVTTSVQPNQQYVYRLDGESERPDPASTHQAESVHGPSVVTDPTFTWRDALWRNHTLRDYVMYELHVGTFAPEGTFDAVIPYLDGLRDLGITAVELMPVGQFPGSRNWGYDGVLPYAVQNSYGGPNGLRRLVDACHTRGLAVILDVVYNHLGPEGNYLSQFGPYFSRRYQGPWGETLNFDGAHSDHVRRYFAENALYWLEEYHIDALRLDATHAIVDQGATHFLEELAERVAAWSERSHRRVYLIAEHDGSNPRLTRPLAAGGMGMDAQWLDDLHHSIHTLLTGENLGYYADYHSFDQLVKCYREGFVYSGEYSQFHQRRHGRSAQGIPAQRFVVSMQNHDQVGNRMQGERLTTLTDHDGVKLAAGATLLSPYLPLLFMGEEYGETAPFLYFVSHGDADLLRAVGEGRKAEFAAFNWQDEPPDPGSEATFTRSRLTHDHGDGVLHGFYCALLALRRTLPALRNPERADMQLWAYAPERVIFMHRRAGAGQASSGDADDDGDVFIIFNFHTSFAASLRPPIPAGTWHKRFDSQDARWQRSDGQVHPAATLPDALEPEVTIPPKSFAVYVREA